MTDQEVIFEIKASVFRRMIALAVLLLSGGLLIYAALGENTTGILWKIILLAAGGLLLAFSEWFRRATGVSIRLTDEGLCDSDGQWLCKTDDITKVDRGAFAMKPNGGFLLRLAEKSQIQWSPGMWWRVGRTLGIGGVTGKGTSKAVGDYLALAVADRNRRAEKEEE